MGIEEGRLSFDVPTSAENDLVNHISYEDILSEFEKLPEVTRKIFKLFYVDNLTVEEISKTFNPSMPTGTIKSTLSRTRRKLKQHLKI